jgi:hypothetical protein
MRDGFLFAVKKRVRKIGAAITTGRDRPMFQRLLEEAPCFEHGVSILSASLI